MTTILAAVDDSPAAAPVIATAVAIAPLFGAEVRAVEIADAVGRTAQAAGEAVSIPVSAVQGDPLTEISRLAADDDVVAVVLGARDRIRGPNPIGHLALALANTSPKPVIIVPPGARPPARVRRALLALKGTPHSRRPLQRAVALAADTDLEVVVVHVDDEDSMPSFTDHVQYDTEVYATEFLGRYAPGAMNARVELRIGIPADEILHAIDEVQPDILAIGWPQSDDPTRGAAARDILNRSRIPVLLVALTNPPT